jgi:CBS domain-containing protein
MSFHGSEPGYSGLPLHALPALALDCETTGLDTENDRVIELAACRIFGDSEEVFEHLIDPGMPIPPKSTEIHHITDTDVAGKPAFSEVMTSFRTWAGKAVIIGYSIGFDIAVLRAEHARAGMKWQAPRSLDVRHLVQVLAPNLPEQSLEVTAEWLGVKIKDRHRALGDARVAAEMFKALIPKLREKNIVTLAQAERACQRLGHRLQQEAAGGWHDPAAVRASIDDTAMRIDSHPYRNQVRDIMSKPPLTAAADTAVSDILKTMMSKRISSIFVGTGTKAADFGILTERDILRAVDAGGAAALASPASAHAQKPLITIPDSTFVYRAIAKMTSRGVRHLAVEDADGNLVGALSARDLLRQRADSAIALGHTIEEAETPAKLGRIWRELIVVTRGLVAEQVDARDIAAIISQELQGLTQRAAQLAEMQMLAEGAGPPPCAYALLVLGSGGRGESLLAMDQDNAIVYADGAPDSDTDKWFERLGSIVADTLNDAGVEYCKGGIMAKNPEWRMSKTQWSERVRSWIGRAKPEDILNSDIFFDAVVVHGDQKLGREVLEDALAVAGENRNFLHVMESKASDFDSAVGWLGKIKTDNGRIDLKKNGIMPIFSAARAVALAHGLKERSTPGRLRAAKAADVRGAHLIDDLIEAHRIMLEAILFQQLRDIRDGIPLSNRVASAELDGHKRQELKWALERSASINDLMGTPARF